MKMIVVSMLTAVFVTGFGAAAFAFSCPMDMKAIDAALAKKPQISAAQLDEVTKLRASGEAHQKAGKHAESVADLHKALGILGIKK